MSKLKISNPFGAKRAGGYQAIPKAEAELPKPDEWQRLTNGGRSTQTMLNSIHEYLIAYHASTGTGELAGWDRLALLGQLYFCSDFWLKRAAKVGNDESYTVRKPQVEFLWLTVVDKLCKAFDCTPNVLPQALEECWGRVLTPHGHQVDTRNTPTGGISSVATYLSRVEVEQYRLRFGNGYCYMRSRTNPKDYIPADSAGIGWTYAPGITDQMMKPHYAGFAMSMGREIFMAHHRGGFNNKNFFHSSYLAGDTVLCTGTIRIDNGRVKAIRNDSGHYQPTLEHLLHVIETLSMHGIPIKGLRVQAVAHSWRYDDGSLAKKELDEDAEVLLKARGNGTGLWFRVQANKAQLASRKGAPVANLRTLPPPPAHV